MSNKFEKLLDYLVNEEMEKANELFHEIVVEKSRTIYETLIAEEAEDEEMDESKMCSSCHKAPCECDESVEEDSEEEDESVEEGVYDEEESMMEIGGDSSDDFVDSVVDRGAMDSDGAMDAGQRMGGGMDGMDSDDEEPATKDDIQRVEDALEQLTAEFEALLADKTEDDSEFDDEDDMDMDMDFDSEDDGEEDSEEDDEEDADEFDDEEDADESFVREYREVVAKGTYDKFGKNSEDSVNAKSAVNANPSDRPVTKANAKNIAQSNGGEGKMDGTKTNMGANAKSLAGSVKGKFTDGSTLNVDGKQTKGYDKSTKKPSKESNVNTKDVLPK
jgi:hypothetical protein